MWTCDLGQRPYNVAVLQDAAGLNGQALLLQQFAEELKDFAGLDSVVVGADDGQEILRVAPEKSLLAGDRDSAALVPCDLNTIEYWPLNDIVVSASFRYNGVEIVIRVDDAAVAVPRGFAAKSDCCTAFGEV